jgi:hypothetical protein
VNVTLSYDLTQSVHFQLTEYDLQGHRVRADIAAPGGRIQYGFSGWYDFYALDYQSFLQQGVGIPWVTFFEGTVAATQLYYRLTGQDYFRGPLDPFLDNLNHGVGLRQSFLLGAADRFVTLGYEFQARDTFSSNGEVFDFLGHQFDLSLQAGLWGFADGVIGYLFNYQDYSEANPRNASGFHRRDPIHQFWIELSRAILPGLRAGFWYIGTIDDSNTDEFRYDRHVVHAGASYAF